VVSVVVGFPVSIVVSCVITLECVVTMLPVVPSPLVDDVSAGAPLVGTLPGVVLLRLVPVSAGMLG